MHRYIGAVHNRTEDRFGSEKPICTVQAEAVRYGQRVNRKSGKGVPTIRHRQHCGSTFRTLRAVVNRLWDAERIRGELRKLDIREAKRTVQKYMRELRPPQPAGQTWATFLRNHAHAIWACDFLLVTDLAFRSLFAFFIIELGSRRVVHAV